MSAATETPAAEESGTDWRSRLAAPAIAVLAVLCCLGAPLIVGAAGALTAGAVFGIVAGGLALLTLCLWAARRLTKSSGC
jgi:hypothetical protein